MQVAALGFTECCSHFPRGGETSEGIDCVWMDRFLLQHRRVGILRAQPPPAPQLAVATGDHNGNRTQLTCSHTTNASQHTPRTHKRRDCTQHMSRYIHTPSRRTHNSRRDTLATPYTHGTLTGHRR